MHPLVPLQRRLLGLRHRDPTLLQQRASDQVRRIATLNIETREGWTRGHILGVPALPAELLGDQHRAVTLQASAVQLATSLGARSLGLGSALAVVGGRGEAVGSQASIPVTTGHAASAWACAELARQVSGRQAVGVLGFRSTVGDAISALLAEDHEVWVEGRGAADTRRAHALGVRCAPRQELLDRVRVLVGASTTGPTLEPSELGPGTVVLDLANPPSLRSGAWPPGVVVLAGETLAWPGRVRSGGWGALWRMLAGYEGGLAYACLAEPLAIAAGLVEAPTGHRRLDPEQVRSMGAALHRLGFRPTLHRRRGPRSAPGP